LSLSFESIFNDALLEQAEQLVIYPVSSYMLPTAIQLSTILQELPSLKFITVSGYMTVHLKDLLIPLDLFHEAEVVGAALLCPLLETQHFRVRLTEKPRRGKGTSENRRPDGGVIGGKTSATWSATSQSPN
jgi:hypothetical protein